LWLQGFAEQALRVVAGISTRANAARPRCYLDLAKAALNSLPLGAPTRGSLRHRALFGVVELHRARNARRRRDHPPQNAIGHAPWPRTLQKDKARPITEGAKNLLAQLA
jgi:hypothetical protein